MRAIVYKAPGAPLVLEEVDDPKPAAGEVIIKVGRCGVCGTDLHMTSEHAPQVEPGAVIGHEFSGEVVALGKDVDRLRVGDRIAAMPATGCGQCSACIAGYPLACDSMEGMVGGFGQYMRVAEDSAIILPQSLSLADGALVEPLAVGLHGVRLSEMQPGAKVLVLGAGSVGLAAIHWARQLGAGKIVAMSRSDRRAERALEMGADAFVAFGEEEATALQDALGGMPDVVLECAGAVGLLHKAVELAKPGATIVSLGFCTQPDAVVPAMATWKRVTVKFSFAYRLDDFEHVADSIDRGHVEPRAMISTTVPLESFPEMFERLRRGADETKVHLDPWS